MFVECAVEFERSLKGDRCLTAFAEFQIVEQQRTIDRMSAVVDDLVGAFNRIFAAKVCYALICNKNVDRVFAVVRMGYHRHDVAYQAAFRY